MASDYKTVKYPIKYGDWSIRQLMNDGDKMMFCAYNFKTDTFLRPVFNSWEDLKHIIDEIK